MSEKKLKRPELSLEFATKEEIQILNLLCAAERLKAQKVKQDVDKREEKNYTKNTAVK